VVLHVLVFKIKNWPTIVVYTSVVWVIKLSFKTNLIINKFSWKKLVKFFFFFFLFTNFNFGIAKFCIMIGDLICASLQVKWSCFNKLIFNFKKLLSSVIVSILVLGSLAMYPFLSYGKHHKLLQMFYLLLSLLMS